MLIKNIDSKFLEATFFEINTFSDSKTFFPEESTLYIVNILEDISFSNSIYYDAGVQLSLSIENSFPIKISKNYGLMLLYLSSSSLCNSIIDYLLYYFKREDKQKLQYTVQPNRIYAEGLELAVKQVDEKGLIAIYCRETKPFRGNIENTKNCIIQAIKEFNDTEYGFNKQSS